MVINPKQSWVQLLVKMFSLPLKLIMVKHTLDQHCLFCHGHYRYKTRNSDKVSWVRVLVKMVLLYVEN
jgi:hypothetical protein